MRCFCSHLTEPRARLILAVERSLIIDEVDRRPDLLGPGSLREATTFDRGVAGHRPV